MFDTQEDAEKWSPKIISGRVRAQVDCKVFFHLSYIQRITCWSDYSHDAFQRNRNRCFYRVSAILISACYNKWYSGPRL